MIILSTITWAIALPLLPNQTYFFSLLKSRRICDGLQESIQTQTEMINTTCHNIVKQCVFVHVDFENMTMNVAASANLV